MAKKRIFTVGFSLPGDEFERIEFESNQTILDADIVLIEPSFGALSFDYDSEYAVRLYAGVPILSEQASFVAKQQIDHWCNEILSAVTAGKLVIIYLTAPTKRYRYTGEKNYSGSGRSRVTHPVVVPVSSYDAVPSLTKVISKSGSSIRVEKDPSFLASYWKEFAAFSPYQVEIEGNFRVLLRATSGDRVIGGAVLYPSSALLFLPPLRWDEEKFEKEPDEDSEEVWTEEAFAFGKRLVSALVGLSDSLEAANQTTPPPSWVVRTEHRLPDEVVLERAVTKCEFSIASLLTEKSKLEVKLSRAGELRRLLFEQGKPLEDAILQAMTLFGFISTSFVDGESEFDGVFVGAEGRCLGEAEGRDNRAINIDKFSQLERNLQEDFARDEVSEYAKGILFGNAYRLLPPAERNDFFTAKCISAAKRVGAALVRSPDLFAPARYLKENPTDSAYAKKCRDAIFATSGDIVKFPEPPFSEVLSTSETMKIPASEAN